MEADPTSKTAPASPASASGSKNSAWGPGRTRSRDGCVGLELGRRAGRQMVPERGGPRTGVQWRPGGQRARAETGEFVAGAAAEPLRPQEAAGHRQVAAAAAALAPDLEHLTLGERQELAGGRRGAVDADLGGGAHGGDVARRAAHEPGATAGELERPGVRGVADQPVGQREGHRIGRTGRGDPHRGHGAPTAVLDHGTQPGNQDLEDQPRASRGSDHGGGTTGRGSSASSARATVKRT